MNLTLLTNKQIIADLAERVDTLRVQNDIQVRDLVAAGVSSSTYARFLKGNTIGLDKLIIILREIGCLEDLNKLCNVVTIDPIAVVEQQTTRKKRVATKSDAMATSDGDDDEAFVWGEDAED
ncbi:MAG: hypothetical protein GY833_12945 [Aestuariibacter sp.]|nr:hypothetical protein [Aestuariibacter sp.]